MAQFGLKGDRNTEKWTIEMTPCDKGDIRNVPSRSIYSCAAIKECSTEFGKYYLPWYIPFMYYFTCARGTVIMQASA